MTQAARPSHRGGPASAGGVVVGVDSSLGVLAAVSWAAAEAARRRVPLHLVEVRPTAAGTTSAHRSVSLCRARAVASAVAPGLVVSAASLVGAAGPALRARARDAELLVLGRRRHTDPACERDGTTHSLLAGAACPTVVVPASWAGSWASTPSARPVVVGLGGTPDDRVVQELAVRIARRLGVELVPVCPGGDLVGTLLDVGRSAQLIVATPHCVELDRLLRRSPCAVVLSPSTHAGTSRHAAPATSGASPVRRRRSEDIRGDRQEVVAESPAPLRL